MKTMSVEEKARIIQYCQVAEGCPLQPIDKIIETITTPFVSIWQERIRDELARARIEQRQPSTTLFNDFVEALRREP